MAAIATQSIIFAGLAPTYSAASASDTVSGVNPDDRLFLHYKNTNAAAATVTITPVIATRRVPGIGVVFTPNLVLTVPANTGDKMTGPIPPDYIDATGTVTMAHTGTITNLTVAAIRLPAVSQ